MRYRSIVAILVAIVFSFHAEAAGYRNRFSLMAGGTVFELSQKNYFEFGKEFEHRLNNWLGIGSTGNYIFTTPGTTTLAVPVFFLHPFENWIINSSPVFLIRSYAHTKIGYRIGTRILLPTSAKIKFVPFLDYDIINGGNLYTFGLSFEIRTN